MQDSDVSPHALARLIANVNKIAQQHERGLLTDLEFYQEVKHATVQCEQTIELHYRMAHADETRKAALDELIDDTTTHPSTTNA